MVSKIFIQQAQVQPKDEKREHSRGSKGDGTKTLTIIIVVADDHLLNLPKLAHLAPEVLIERIEVVLQLARIHLVLRVVGGVLV